MHEVGQRGFATRTHDGGNSTVPRNRRTLRVFSTSALFSSFPAASSTLRKGVPPGVPRKGVPGGLSSAEALIITHEPRAQWD